MIPLIIRAIADKVLLFIASCNKVNDKSGTKIYPNASNIGKSFTLTPFANATMFITTDTTKTL